MKTLKVSFTMGLLLIILPNLLYYFFGNPSSYSFKNTSVFQFLGIGFFLGIFLGLILIFLSLRELLKVYSVELKKSDYSLEFKWLIAYIFDKPYYSKIFVVGSLLYGLIYSFFTGMLIYDSETIFSEAYGVKIPSVILTTCCDSVGNIPFLSVYLSEHFGLLIKPISVIVLPIISILVGLNICLVLFVWKTKPKTAQFKWYAGFGAVIGLFTGCPTCAGLIFMGLFPSGLAFFTISLFSISSFVQYFLILVTIPVLLLGPYILFKSLTSMNNCTLNKGKFIKN